MKKTGIKIQYPFRLINTNYIWEVRLGYFDPWLWLKVMGTIFFFFFQTNILCKTHFCFTSIEFHYIHKSSQTKPGRRKKLWNFNGKMPKYLLQFNFLVFMSWHTHTNRPTDQPFSQPANNRFYHQPKKTINNNKSKIGRKSLMMMMIFG